MRGKDKLGFRNFCVYLEEAGLDLALREIARRHGVTLYEAYSDARGPAVVAARTEMWYHLTTSVGRSPAEVAKIFDRDRGAVAASLKKLHATAAQLALEITPGTATSVVRLVVSEGRRVRRAV